MITLLNADCRDAMIDQGPFDLLIQDPPYQETSLKWDRKVPGWMAAARARLKRTGSMWVFGSMRYFIAEGAPKGWRLAQDCVWEKRNGTGFAKDRFRRVHEHVVQFYRDDAPWDDVYNDVQRVPRTGPDKTGATRKQIAHASAMEPRAYVDDGTRIMRSVLTFPSVRHVGRHETEKPVDLLEVLIRTSCPPGGLVGDFFAGSGACGEAAAICGRNYVGCEIDPLKHAKAHDRLQAYLRSAA